MPAYKLLYFNVRARGEVIRIIFAEAGADYEDERIEFSEWPKIKPTTPLGQVPVLMIDGKPLPQSGAIVRYLAREFNLNAETSTEEAYADMIWETQSELMGKLPFMEKDPEKKKQMYEEVREKNIHPFLKKLEEVLKQADDKCHLVGKKFTYADIAIVVLKHQLDDFDANSFDPYPTLRDHNVRSTMERPNIKAYIDKRVKTPL